VQSLSPGNSLDQWRELLNPVSVGSFLDLTPAHFLHSLFCPIERVRSNCLTLFLQFDLRVFSPTSYHSVHFDTPSLVPCILVTIPFPPWSYPPSTKVNFLFCVLLWTFSPTELTNPHVFNFPSHPTFPNLVPSDSHQRPVPSLIRDFFFLLKLVQPVFLYTMGHFFGQPILLKQ